MLIADKSHCQYCNWSASGFLGTLGLGYQYVIEELGEEVKDIFNPIELEKEIKQCQKKN